MRTCVIIPTYNESKAIAGLIEQILKLGLKTIIIDDGSNDDTIKIALDAGAEVLHNPSNIGKGASLIKGYAFALSRGFDAVISMDGDGQHSTEDIKLFIQKAESSNYGIIVGNRMAKTQGMPVMRIVVNRFMSWVISMIAGQNIPDTQCGFRMVKKEVFQAVDLSTSKYETESEILIKASRRGFKIGSVQVKTIYSGQKSRINPFVDSLRFLRFIVVEFTRGFKT
ncbi:MAG: glycosyltransferase family 2 protein [Candidatus Omnitrophica bacterium]|nr:glycosyltransferase family 2 protein [Candidatus Omnitrophota bacterium]